MSALLPSVEDMEKEDEIEDTTTHFFNGGPRPWGRSDLMIALS